MIDMETGVICCTTNKRLTEKVNLSIRWLGLLLFKISNILAEVNIRMNG